MNDKSVIPSAEGWISVEDNLPPKGRTVNISMLYKERRWVSSGFIASDGKWYTDVLNGSSLPDKANAIDYLITHWMPLPSPPKE